MSENKNNNPNGEPKNTPDQNKETDIKKGNKNPDSTQHPVDEINDEDRIENPDKNREHDDTDHEHDYKTPSDNSFNQKNNKTSEKNNKS